MTQSFPFTASYWLPQSLAPVPSLGGEHTTDIVVIGGGYGGLCSALGLLNRQPDLHVTVVEAQHIGYGASGRNAGFVMNLPPLVWLLDDLTNPQCVDDLRWTTAFNTENTRAVGLLLDAEGVDVEWTSTQHMLVARNSIEAATLRWLATRFTAAGLESSYHKGDAAKALIGYPAQAGRPSPWCSCIPTSWHAACRPS